jgi:hypothetical protein
MIRGRVVVTCTSEVLLHLEDLSLDPPLQLAGEGEY